MITKAEKTGIREYNKEKKSDLAMKLLLSLYAILMIIIARYAILTNATTWLWDAGVTFTIVFVVYLSRNKLRLNAWLYAMFLFSLALHTLGVYGFYTKQFFGLDFDHYTHFFASFAVSMILCNWLLHYNNLKSKFATVCFIAILMTIGISAIHETIEFLGYTFLNADGANLFFPGNTAIPSLTAADIGDSGTYSNTMIDIIYNMVGAVAGCVVIGMNKLF
ncbi:MAG: DUF2238 domain-containing protein [Candidatus Woesearchaeota archaeon]